MKYMMKLFCMLTAVSMLLCCAAAESTPEASPSPTILLVTPTPTAVPMGAVFSSEDLIVTLPYGMEILDDAARAGYDAAAEADFPGASSTLLAAANADRSAVVHFSVSEMETDAAAAARSAAQTILNSTATVFDLQCGENSYSGFVCAIGDQIYNLYYLSGEGRMLMIGASGLSEGELSAMLTGLIF